MWINGFRQSTVAASDRALQFGDGCFTTAAVRQGKIVMLESHIQRLKEGCERLWIAGVDWHQLETEMKQAAYEQTQAVLKVIISAGSGGRGYSRRGCGEPVRIVSLAAWPQHYTDIQQRGARLRLSPIRLARNPQFAGIKHLNRVEQVMIRVHLDQTDADEALVLDTEGWVVECCAANLFWRQGTQIFTPDLSASGVDGIMRRSLMAQLAAAGQACQIVKSEPAQLLAADEVVICNALMPVLPVRQIEAVQFTERSLFKQLLASCEQIMDAS
ncbi:MULTISPECIES: aminodeoxychorismate lyase [unclassified Pantoea]|uniref:aminodeoxychorismate lyase n=1 Tax=unclassified Pantoea TaxID=2630326 RepID=UPI0023DC5718|nr:MULTISPECIES: aminodeoxychorismate lyase [unclassified Pantoea]MDF2043030.1 aminodeoxychorismate lyase [Pantoea sp. Cr_R14]MDF2069424.1 aminodeoxychorismate lyase [Pantoea sp. Cr_R13]MDF2080054.1 aminodeoxychorismate lyase [Pantoea sp. Cr_R21]